MQMQKNPSVLKSYLMYLKGSMLVNKQLMSIEGFPRLVSSKFVHRLLEILIFLDLNLLDIGMSFISYF